MDSPKNKTCLFGMFLSPAEPSYSTRKRFSIFCPKRLDCFKRPGKHPQRFPFVQKCRLSTAWLVREMAQADCIGFWTAHKKLQYHLQPTEQKSANLCVAHFIKVIPLIELVSFIIFCGIYSYLVSDFRLQKNRRKNEMLTYDECKNLLQA